MAKKNDTPNGEMNNIDRLVANLAFGAMAEMLLLPKKIDELKKLPAYVKDGEVYDFNDRSFGKTYKPDGEIFSVERVRTQQAVTQAIKTAYIKALTEWMETSEDDAKAGAEPKKVKKPKVEDTEEGSDEDNVPTIDLVSMVTALLDEGKIKKANKLVKDNPDHPKIKKAKKLVKKSEG